MILLILEIWAALIMAVLLVWLVLLPFLAPGLFIAWRNEKKDKLSPNAWRYR